VTKTRKAGWLGTATAVSATRFTSLKHFPTDVVVGNTFGYLIGRHIFHAHCKAGLSPACEGKFSLSQPRTKDEDRRPYRTH